MTTLRQRQKRKRSREILDTADKLFRSKGFINTSIEEIADKAEVGVGTVYNYFQSKSRLLMALFRRYHLELKENGNAILNRPSDDVLETLCNLLRVYFEGPMKYFTKDIMRELFSILSNEHLPIRRESMELDYLLINQITELIEFFQERNQIIKNVASSELSIPIYSIFMMSSMMYIYDDDMTMEAAEELMRKSLQVIYNGLKP
jgi:AcrR family transcriptional regulator